MTTSVYIGAGTHIDRAAAMMIEAAKRGDGEAAAEFNGVALRATATSTPQEITAEYDRITAERAAAYRRSPEGIAAAPKQV